MYHPVKVEGLSTGQIGKLLRGQAVRVKHHPQGHHTLHLSQAQAKKLAKAHAKGSGMNVQLDPYQMDQHQHLRGTGIKSVLKKAVGLAKHHLVKEAKKHRPAVEKFVRQQAHKGLQHAKQLADAKLQEGYEHLSHQIMPPETVEGEGFGRFMKKVGRALKPVGKVLKPIAKDFAKSALKAGVSALVPEAAPFVAGLGVKHKRKHHKKGGALMVAGRGVKKVGRPRKVGRPKGSGLAVNQIDGVVSPSTFGFDWD